VRSLPPISPTATGVRLRLTAPPVDGTANEALVRFLAVLLKVPRSAVELESGRTGRTKLVAVAGVSVAETARRLGVCHLSPTPISLGSSRTTIESVAICAACGHVKQSAKTLAPWRFSPGDFS
jgi:uncharacterized protein YggU (UPF0235/DUF167 family)